MSELKFKVGDKVVTEAGNEAIVIEVDSSTIDNLPYRISAVTDNAVYWAMEHEIKLSKENPWHGLTGQEQEAILGSLKVDLDRCLEYYEGAYDERIELLKQLITKLKGE